MTEWTPDTVLHAARDPHDFGGLIPESWLCVDCGFNTAPGLFSRREMEAAFKKLDVLLDDPGVEQHIDDRSEVYTVRDAIWKKAGMDGWGGCLCIGCLEKRIGRRLKPKDFLRDHPLNRLPGTPRLLDRRGRFR
jgi:hypothetical protein